MKYKIIPHTLNFKFKAGTSRGFYTIHNIWYVILEENGVQGIGEIAPLKDLSIDAISDLEIIIKHKLTDLITLKSPKNFIEISDVLDNLNLDKYPSIRFGFETALLDLVNGGKRIIFDNDFNNGLKKTPINGLIWMGDKAFMFNQVKEKIEQGFSCIKMKIGAIDFKQECELISYIRSQFSAKEIELRVDANGAFSKNEALEKLKIFSQFEIHSIEQPIKQGQFEDMKLLCELSPIDIALDEELIGVDDVLEKRHLLELINPQYIILKPTLVGGLQKTKEWIDIAESLNINWWMTSALESNIGLNAISQFSAEFDNNLPQGLGTGSLYHNNIESPLTVENGFIYIDNSKSWNFKSV